MRGTYRRLALAAGAGLLATLPLGAAGEKIDYEAINKIKAEGMQLQNSKVMEISSWLTDVHGPRLSGSPNIQKAGDWAVTQLKAWGLQNVTLEKWPNQSFPRGWTNDKFYLAAVSPQAFPIPGTPVGWTPGTDGLVRGDVVLVTETTQEDLQKYKGSLKGKWIMTQAVPDVAAFWNPPATRRTPEELRQMELATTPSLEFGVSASGARGGRGGQGAPARPEAAADRGGSARVQSQRVLQDRRGARHAVDTPRGHGVYTIGGNRNADPATMLPAISIPAEHYGRMARMLAKDLPVTIEADIRNTYYAEPADVQRRRRDSAAPTRRTKS